MTDDEMLSASRIRHSEGTMISPIALFITNKAQHYCTHGRVVMMIPRGLPRAASGML